MTHDLEVTSDLCLGLCDSWYVWLVTHDMCDSWCVTCDLWQMWLIRCDSRLVTCVMCDPWHVWILNGCFSLVTSAFSKIVKRTLAKNGDFRNCSAFCRFPCHCSIVEIKCARCLFICYLPGHSLCRRPKHASTRRLPFPPSPGAPPSVSWFRGVLWHQEALVEGGPWRHSVVRMFPAGWRKKFDKWSSTQTLQVT